MRAQAVGHEVEDQAGKSDAPAEDLASQGGHTLPANLHTGKRDGLARIMEGSFRYL